MIHPFINSFRSEWLKTKRSAAFWLVIIGGCFIPLLMLSATLIKSESAAKAYATEQFWITYNKQCWQFMAFTLLPMGVILATSLITQLEYKNNAWKQLMTTPQTMSCIFLSKLSVIITMMAQFFIFFNAGIFLSAILPCIFIPDIPFPMEPFPIRFILAYNTNYFVDCLPMIALQYLISLRFKNFLVAVGAGLAFLVASMFAVQWQYGYFIPYTYCILNFLGKESIENSFLPQLNIHLLAVAYSIIFTIAGYLFFITKNEKG